VTLLTLIAILGPITAHSQSYPWLYEEWDSPNDKTVYRDFRLKCENLVWGLKTPVDVLDRKAIDKLYTEKIDDYRRSKTLDNAFFLVCAMAHFGPNADAQVAMQLGSFLPKAAGYRSYEFTRVAHAASVLYKEPILPKTDIESRLLAVRKDDPLVMLAMVASAQLLNGFQPEHERAVRLAEQLYDTYPLRREKYRVILIVAIQDGWARSGLWAKKPRPEMYDRMMKLMSEALADPQTSESDRKSVVNLKKYSESLKPRIDGGGGNLSSQPMPG
jgi:hypothetical protein